MSELIDEEALMPNCLLAFYAHLRDGWLWRLRVREGLKLEVEEDLA